MAMIEVRSQSEAPLAFIGFTDEEMARLEFIMAQHHESDVGGSPLWLKVRHARLDLDKVTRQLPVIMGGRRDYYESSGD